jgi:hypothetical protein
VSKYNCIRIEPNKSYGLHKIGPGCIRIVKNLKDYADEQEAISDLMELLDGRVSESDLIGSDFSQSMEAGKLSNRILCLESEIKNIRGCLIDAIGDNELLEKAVRESIKRIDDILRS